MSDMQTIVDAVRSSGNFASEVRYVGRGGYDGDRGERGQAAIRKSVAWKEASGTRFLNGESESGTAEALALGIANFWKTLDRMFGGGWLVNYEPEAVKRGVRTG
ncbi:MAG: hypothetical protein ACOY71_01755 [Gemmatimonadota bacterium]